MKIQITVRLHNNDIFTGTLVEENLYVGRNKISICSIKKFCIEYDGYRRSKRGIIAFDDGTCINIRPTSLTFFSRSNKYISGNLIIGSKVFGHKVTLYATDIATLSWDEMIVENCLES